MATVDLIMPKLGESITEATILKWHKNPGDRVKMDETVLDIATDKVDSEVPSTADGVIESILFKINDVVPVGTVIARIKTNAGEAVLHEAPKTQPIQRNIPNQHAQEAVVVETTSSAPSKNQSSNGSANRFYSPLVLNIAANEGVSMTELEALPGTGNEGRVTKKDILQYVSDRKSGTRTHKTETRREEQRSITQHELAVIKEPVANEREQSALTTYSGNVEIIEMDRMRKMIAEHMVRSKHTSPHVTSFTQPKIPNS